MPDQTMCSFWRWNRLRCSTRVDSISTTSRSRCSGVLWTCGPSWSAKSQSGSGVMHRSVAADGDVRDPTDPSVSAYAPLMATLPGPEEYAAHRDDHHHRDVSGGALRAA